jgi:hypothetical protein
MIAICDFRGIIGVNNKLDYRWSRKCDLLVSLRDLKYYLIFLVKLDKKI